MSTSTPDLLQTSGSLRPQKFPYPIQLLWWGGRAIWHELLGFQFDYPIEVVSAAGSRDTLHYYIYSERLFFDVMELDPQGIPLQRSRIFGETYNPAYVAWYGLMSLERSLRGLEPPGSRAFLTQVEWLVAHGVRHDDGSIVWPLTFDWQEGDCSFKAPWISAMAQGLAISALVRGYRMTGQQYLLDLCYGASGVFEEKVEDGGVRTLERGHVLYEEYPGFPLPRVLDGFLFSLLGLYDLSAETGDLKVAQLFVDGIDGLKHMLEFWNYRDKWSRYGSHGYLCPPQYNKLNGALLISLGRLSGNRILGRYAEAWDSGRLTALGRIEVLFVFLFTKNWFRLQHARYRQ